MYGFVAKAPASKEDTRRGFVDKTFKDKDGRVNLAAIPNVPLTVWILAEVLAAVTHGGVHKGARIVALISLGIWALLELFSGVNYFRRALGLVVLVGVIMSAH